MSNKPPQTDIQQTPSSERLAAVDGESPSPSDAEVLVESGFEADPFFSDHDDPSWMNLDLADRSFIDEDESTNPASSGSLQRYTPTSPPTSDPHRDVTRIASPPLSDTEQTRIAPFPQIPSGHRYLPPEEADTPMQGTALPVEGLELSAVLSSSSVPAPVVDDVPLLEADALGIELLEADALGIEMIEPEQTRTEQGPAPMPVRQQAMTVAHAPPEPWGRYVSELEREVTYEPEARLKAAFLHEVADVLRMSGDRWRQQAFALDRRALSLYALYWPSLRARLVECWRSGDREGYRDELMSAVTLVSATDIGAGPREAQDRMLADLLVELGLVLEEEGEHQEAEARYIKATRLGRQDPFFFVNLARVFAASGDLEGLWEAMAATAALGGAGPEAQALQGAVLADIGEMLRRAGYVTEARDVYREALEADPLQIEPYRGLELLGWRAGDVALEAEGVSGHLALLVNEGVHLDRQDERRRVLKRKAAGRFYQLARLQARLGDIKAALASMGDALGVRQELLYVRSRTRMAQRAGDMGLIQEGLARQVVMASDPALQTQLMIEQACWALEVDPGEVGRTRARDFLARCLQVAPDCLPAQVELGRLMIQEGDAAGLLTLWADAPGEEAPVGVESALRAWRRGGILEAMLGDDDAALGEYLTALERDPPPEGSSDGGVRPWVRAVERLLLLRGAPEEVAAFYDRAVERHPGRDPERRAWLLKAARHAEQSGRLERAIALWLELLDGEVVSLERLEALAHLYRELGWRAEALEVFEEVVQLGLEASRALTGEEAEAGGDAAQRGLLWMASLLEEEGRHDEVGVIWDRVLELRPGDPRALEAQRESLLRSGDYGRLADLLESQAEESEDPVRRRALWMEAAELCLDRIRDRRRGQGLLRRVCEEAPGYAPAWDLLEESLRARRQWAELAELLLARSERATDGGEALRLAWEASLLWRERLEDDAQALEALRAVLAIAPGFVPALRVAAETLHRLGRFEELAAHYAGWRAQASPTDAVWLPLTQALAYVREVHLGQLEEALELHVDVLEQTAEHRPTVASLEAAARLCRRLGLPERQLETLLRLNERVEDRRVKAGLLRYVARAQERLGRDAAETWRRLLELSGDDLEGDDAGQARRGVERSVARFGQGARRVSHYLSLAKRDPGPRRTHYLVQIAAAYQSMGRLSDAAEILRQVTAIDPSHTAAQLMRAQLAVALGDMEGAAELEEALAASAPPGPLRVAHLERAARLYMEELGQPERAEPLLRRVVEDDPGHVEAYARLRGLYGESLDEGDPERLLTLIDARLEVERGGAARVELLREAAGLAAEVAPERALGYLEALLEEDAEDAEAVERAAALAARLGRLEAAAAWHARRLELRAPEPEGRRAARLVELSRLLVDELGRSDEAVPLLEALLVLEPRHLEGLRLMARVRLARGEAAEACRAYKDLFELDMAEDLPLIIARLLDVELGRKQEALTWYLRAQDVAPLDGQALDGVLSIARGVQREPGPEIGVRMVRDRLDWLADSHREALREDPWALPLMRQLASIELGRGRVSKATELAHVLGYFGALGGDGTLRALAADSPSGPGPERLLGAQAVMLSNDHVRGEILPEAARGFRRQLFAMLWDAVAQVDPDDLSARGLTRSDRRTERDDLAPTRNARKVAQVLGVYGVDFYLHPTDPFVVLPLFTPEPTLVLGERVLRDPGDVDHHFRVAFALEQLRDGKGLLRRDDVVAMLAALDEALEAMMGGALDVLPAFSRGGAPNWLGDASRRLQRAVNRRTRRDLRTLLDIGPAGRMPPVQDWLEACRAAPIRVGLAVSGDFGAAADALAETSFRLQRGAEKREEVVLGALRDGPAREGVEAALRFALSEEYDQLRSALGVAPYLHTDGRSR